MGRFKEFNKTEQNVLHDALMEACQLDPEEDETFPPLVEAAEKMYEELQEDRK